jgi:hypothetical protein
VLPLFGVATAVAAALAAPSPADAHGELAIQLRIRVSRCPDLAGGAGLTLQPGDWIEEHVQAAAGLLAPHAIRITAVTEPLTPSLCQLLTRADRDAFADQVEMDGAITVLVVPRVRDLDLPTYDLKGVHWRARGRRWIFLTAGARPPVLAHELAHYFGLPHDPAGGNLMTPGPSSPAWRSRRPPAPFAPVLTPAQVEHLRRGIARHLRRHARAPFRVAAPG